MPRSLRLSSIVILVALLAPFLGGCSGWHSRPSDWTPASPLMASIANGDVGGVRAIVLSGSEDVNTPRRHNKDGRLGDFEVGAPTPLMFAVMEDREEMIPILMVHGANPRLGDDNNDAWFHACNLDTFRKNNGEKRSRVPQILKQCAERQGLDLPWPSWAAQDGPPSH